MNNQIYIDDVFEHIEDDVEKIRKKTGMYIPYKEEAGAKHLLQELIDNVMDEINNPNSPGNSCMVEFNEIENKITVSDNGRGIPFDKVELICTKIQSGSKFDRENGDNSAGENGVGLTAVNALSKYLKFTIYRQLSDGNYVGTFEFAKGKLINTYLKKSRGQKHGTTIEMIPDEEILGKCQLSPEIIIEYLDKLSYVINIPIRLIINDSDKYTFYHKNGIIEYVDKLSTEKVIPIIKLESSAEDINLISVAFTYDTSINEELIDSFVNRVNTIEGGQHVMGARNGISYVITKLSNDFLSEAERKKFEITSDDCKNGLVMVVNISCKYPGYAGQQKEKCGNKALFAPIRNIVGRLLRNYFEDNPKVLTKLVNYMKKVAKSRLTVARLRKSDVAALDSFKSNKMANFSDATESSNDNEIYLIEGLSAKGSIMKARDPRFQAALSFKGVTANSLKLTPVQIMQNPEYATLVKASGMGIGDQFDINKSRYKRYIISTDADIDGWKITSGIASFFLFHWSEVVKAGMLYVALTPLYMIKRDNGSYDYLVSKAELFNEKVLSYIEKAQIRTQDGHVLSKEEFKDFLIKNKNYEDILKELYSHEFVHPDIIEYILGHRDDISDMKTRFPEIKINNYVLSGSYLGVYQYLLIDQRFYEKSEKLRKAIEENGNIYFDYRDGSDWIKDCSLGFILRELKKFDLEIKQRWKGLGSIPAQIFWNIVMNPAKRTLVQLTMDDFKRDMELMTILHGDNAANRRNLLQKYNLDKDDIDS